MMDNRMFHKILGQSAYHPQRTSYIEIYLFNDPTKNVAVDGHLTTADFTAWFRQEGSFSPKFPSDGIVRLVVQPECEPATFESRVITLPHSDFEDMTKILNLSTRLLECTNNVGPFLWSVTCKNGPDQHLQLIYRNVQGMKVGHCQGWELAIAYVPATRTTTGFVRGTEKSFVKEWIAQLKGSPEDAVYPLLLPSIILTEEMNAISTSGEQCSREWLYNVEEKFRHLHSDTTNPLKRFTEIENDLLNIHKAIVAKHPQTQSEVVKVFERTVEEFAALDRNPITDLSKYRDVMHGSVTFNKTKLEDLQADVVVTLSRVEILRSAVQNRLAVALAEQQRDSDRIKHEANMKYSKNQQTFSILGVLFLPGTFFAAIFSTTFFDFHPEGEGPVSKSFWVFWVFTLPTMAALMVFLFWDFIYPGSEKFQWHWSWPKRRNILVLKKEESKV